MELFTQTAGNSTDPIQVWISRGSAPVAGCELGGTCVPSRPPGSAVMALGPCLMSVTCVGSVFISVRLAKRLSILLFFFFFWKQQLFVSLIFSESLLFSRSLANWRAYFNTCRHASGRSLEKGRAGGSCQRWDTSCGEPSPSSVSRSERESTRDRSTSSLLHPVLACPRCKLPCPHTALGSQSAQTSEGAWVLGPTQCLLPALAIESGEGSPRRLGDARWTSLATAQQPETGSPGGRAPVGQDFYVTVLKLMDRVQSW